MFKILTFLLICILLVPPLIPCTSIRIENLFIFLLTPILLIKIKTVLKDDSREVCLAFFYLFLGVLISCLFQILIFGFEGFMEYFLLAQGFFRSFLFACLASVAVDSHKKLKIVTQLIAFGVIMGAGVCLVEYSDLQPIDAWINTTFRGDAAFGSTIRAIGIFETVHACAFFGVYSFLFLVNYKKTFNKFLLQISSWCGLIISILPFSRAAFITLIFAFPILIYSKKILSAKELFYTLPFLSLLFILFKEDITILYKIFDDLLSGFMFIFQKTGTGDKSIGYIEGRLNWGWENAITTFQANPFFGKIYQEQKDFSGDGGYTQLLASTGLIGMVGFFLFFYFLGKSKIEKCIKYCFIISIVVHSLATGFLKERSIELLPILLVLLAKTKKLLINSCK